MELMITILLHRRDEGDWTEAELDPVLSFEIQDITSAYSALGARLALRDGRRLIVDFADIDGNRGC